MENKRKALVAQVAKSKRVTEMFAAGADLAGVSSTDAAASADPSQQQVVSGYTGSNVPLSVTLPTRPQLFHSQKRGLWQF